MTPSPARRPRRPCSTSRWTRSTRPRSSRTAASPGGATSRIGALAKKPPDGVVFTDISIGRRHACGLDVTGTAHCWGDDTELEPFPDPPAGAFAKIESFSRVSCVIDAVGVTTCWWGSDLDFFELWTLQMPTAPLAQIGIGEWAGCGVDTAGNAYCWGGDPATQSWLDVPDLNP